MTYREPSSKPPRKRSVSNGSGGYLIVEGADRKKENPNDFYPTPTLFVQNSLKLLPSDFKPTKVFDPGLGDGVWGNVAKDKWPDAEVNGIDVDPRFAPYTKFCKVYRDDFRYWSNPDGLYDLVIGNPPYSLSQGNRDNNLAAKFVLNSLNMLREGGYLLFLMNQRFLEGQFRARMIYQTVRPITFYQSVRRIPFLDVKKTNAVSYGLYLWKKGEHSNTTIRWFDWKTGSII